MNQQHLNAELLLAVLFLALFSLLVLPSEAAKKQISGEHIFKERCAKCHVGGANTLKPDKPLAGSRQLQSIATFKSYLKAPPGHMPYYQEIVENKESLKALYEYCKTIKAKPMTQAMLAPELY